MRVRLGAAIEVARQLRFDTEFLDQVAASSAQPFNPTQQALHHIVSLTGHADAVTRERMAAQQRDGRRTVLPAQRPVNARRRAHGGGVLDVGVAHLGQGAGIREAAPGGLLLADAQLPEAGVDEVRESRNVALCAKSVPVLALPVSVGGRDFSWVPCSVGSWLSSWVGPPQRAAMPLIDAEIIEDPHRE